MKSIVLEDFLDFESHFDEFVKRTVFFEDILKAQFFVFNESFTEIAYTYRFKSDEKLEIEDVKNIIHGSKRIWSEGYVEILEYGNEEGFCEGQNIIINVFNHSSDEKVVLGSLFICCEFDIENHNHGRFNTHYFQQLIYHVQTIITNYEKLYFIIDIFTELIVAKDKYMPYHMTNVANLCIKMSVYLELTPKEQMLLYYSALLHDIGKLFVSENIINKPDKLTGEEYERVKAHSNKGAEIVMATLHGMTLLNEVPRIIRHHHENYDGSGYPDGLENHDIPYLSRILKVADTVDAMSSRRAYKDVESLNKIIEELARYSGRQFDPIAADAMIQILLNDIQVMEKGRLDANVFIPQASLSFKYSVNGELRSLSGNLLVKNEKGHFIVHDMDKSTYSIDEMYKTTLSYFEQNDFIEHKIDITHFSNGKYYLENFIYIPTDKTFSMVWDGTAPVIDRNTNESFKSRVLKLGGDSIVIQLDESDGENLIHHQDDIYQIKIDERVEDIALEMTLGIRFVKFYKKDRGIVLIGRYTDIQPGQKDKLLRLLFRKQIENRKTKAKIKMDAGGNK